jgi:hypothetical protein
MAEADSNEMDKQAEHAKRELMQAFSQWDALGISRWWKKWYLKAGHKRLGRVLLDLHDQKSKIVASKISTAPIPAAPAATRKFNFDEDLSASINPQKADTPFEKISRATKLIQAAEQTVLSDIRSGLVKDEEGITERLVGAIHHQFNDKLYAGVRWSAMTLTAHKRNAQESWYGADLLGVLQIDFDDYSVQKGFLVQAKYLRNSDRLASSEFARLKQQCAKMLSHSSAAFVFLYQPNGISVLPAVSVVSLDDAAKLADLKRRTFAGFFEEHFDCFVGDQALHSPTDKNLEELQKKVAAHHVIALSGQAQ